MMWLLLYFCLASHFGAPLTWANLAIAAFVGLICQGICAVFVAVANNR